MKISKPYQKFCRNYIKLQQDIIDQSTFLIQKLAQENVKNFHFMNHKVSTFWRCDLSPIGMCVYQLDKYNHNCIYCNNPEERK